MTTLLVIQTTRAVIRTTEDVNKLGEKSCYDDKEIMLRVIAVNWSGSSLPGQVLTSASDNDKIAARDTPGPPLSPDDFR